MVAHDREALIAGDRRFVALLAALGGIVWFAAWAAAFHLVDGWRTSDVGTYFQIEQLEADKGTFVVALHLLGDLLAFVPLGLHWTIGSLDVPRLWRHTAEFRALVGWAIGVHLLVIVAVAIMLDRLARNAVVTVAAFALFMATPAMWLAAPTLDPRFLAIVFAVPAVLLAVSPSSVPRVVIAERLASGMLAALAVQTDAESVFFVASFAIASLIAGIAVQRKIVDPLAVLINQAWGFLAIFYLSHWLFGAQDDIIAHVLALPFQHELPYARLVSIGAWIQAYTTQLGIVEVVLAITGVAALSIRATRPAYVSTAVAQTVAGTLVVGAAIVAIWQIPAYYQVYGVFQPFVALAAAVGAERVVTLAASRSRRGAPAWVLPLLVLGSIVVPFQRCAEVLADETGFGRAATATARAPFFLQTYTWDAGDRSVTTRRQWDALSDADVLTTDFPLFFLANYPDLRGILAETQPLARFPTPWCSSEAFYEGAPLYGERRWAAEPELCEARTYRFRDLRRAQGGERVGVAQIDADSHMSAASEPSRAIVSHDGPISDDYHDPSVAVDAWLAAPDTAVPHVHWIQLRFDRSIALGNVTLVAPDAVVRSAGAEAIRIVGFDASGRAHTLWSHPEMLDPPVLLASFPTTSIRALRIELTPPGGDAATETGIAAIHLPGYRLVAAAP